MTRSLLLAAFLSLTLLPSGAFAADFAEGRSVLIATSTSGNRYALGGSVAVTTPIYGDLTALGASIVSDANVTGDALFLGGTITANGSIAQDARLVGASVKLAAPVGGDLVSAAGSFTDTGGGAADVYVAAINTSLLNGARGPVTVYANNVALGGVFTRDVTVVAAGRLSLASSTRIAGSLTYESPEEAIIATGATVTGGVHYEGASYLPTREGVHAIALASFGIFLFIRILGALILAGLIAGLFPTLSELVINRALQATPARAVLTLFLGFALIVALPVLIILLSVTFIGLGVALMLGLLYLLFFALAFVYGAVLVGSVLVRAFGRRAPVSWSDAVLGMLALFLLWSLPFVGWILVGLLTFYALGVLALISFAFAFRGTAV